MPVALGARRNLIEISAHRPWGIPALIAPTLAHGLDHEIRVDGSLLVGQDEIVHDRQALDLLTRLLKALLKSLIIDVRLKLPHPCEVRLGGFLDAEPLATHQLPDGLGVTPGASHHELVNVAIRHLLWRYPRTQIQQCAIARILL